MIKQIFVLGAASMLLFSCKKEVDDNKTFKGATVQVHGGKAWSWISIKDKEVPDQMGITIENAVLASLPMDDGHDHMENHFSLPLHPKSSLTPFKVVGMDWAPEGHPPAGVYTKPHFDFHFYMVSQAEVDATTNMEKMEILPAEGYLPAVFVPGPPVPQMGKHWPDRTSPELDPVNPQPFTQSFLYGSYDGKVTFYEPMITLDFLNNTQNFERPIPQPVRFQQAGYYPTKMKVQKDNKVTNIILSGFVYRTAS